MTSSVTTTLLSAAHQNPLQLAHMKCCLSHTARALEALTWEVVRGSPTLWIKVWMVDQTCAVYNV